MSHLTHNYQLSYHYNTIMTYTHKYSTWAEFMTAVTTGQRSPASNTTSQREYYESDPWSGTNTFAKSLRHLNEGWKEGLSRIEEVRRRLPSDLFDGIMPVKDYKPELRHQIAGGTIDVVAHIVGASPETFIAEVAPINDEGPIKTGRRLQTIYYSMGNSSFTDKEAFFWRGAYTYLMVEHMENCGFSVELWGLNNVTGSVFGGAGHAQRIYVKIKEFGELFNNNKLAVALGSSFMLRRYIFALMEQYTTPDEIAITHGAYGYPVSSANVEDIVLSEDADLNPLFINTVNVSEPSKMLEEFRGILKRHLEGNVLTA